VALVRDQQQASVVSDLRGRLEAAEKALAAERAEVEPLRRRLEATELALAMVGHGDKIFCVFETFIDIA
jgi:hypothetical protein